MKTKIFRLCMGCFLVLILITVFDCKKKDEPVKKVEPVYTDIAVVDVSNETGWDYWVVGKNGDYFYLQEAASKPTTVLMHIEETSTEIPIFFNPDGLPEKVIIGDYIFIFGNYIGYYVDLAVILPDGNIEVARDIKTEIDWDQVKKKNKSSNEAWSDVIRLAGRFVGSIPCSVSIAATILTSGSTLPVALWKCGNYVLKLAGDVAEHELGLHNGFTEFTENWGNTNTAIKCTSGQISDCLFSMASSALGALADKAEVLEQNNEKVTIAKLLLQNGVKVTTSPVSIFSSNSATVGGHIVSDGIDDITERGVYYSTSQNPDITGTKLQIGSGTGTFSTILLGLTPNTKYYTKAYAVNSKGISYGSQENFTTLNSSGLYEDFETYLSGSFPNSWISDGNGNDVLTNYIDNSIFYTGGKSLKLFGSIGGCWAAIAYHNLTVTPTFEIELAVRNGDETLSGCNPDRALIGLREGTNWENPSRTFIYFKGDGKLYGGGGLELCPYNNNTWYLIRIKYEVISSTEIKLSYWINNSSLGNEVLSSSSDENLFDNLEICVLEGSAWFDDVKVLK